MNRICIAAIAGALLSAHTVTGAMPVKVTGGLIEGTTGIDPSVRVFRGIPFAAPPVGALRWKDPTPDKQWEGFQLIREVQQSGELRVTLELRGLGDVRIDDLRVMAVDPDR